MAEQQKKSSGNQQGCLGCLAVLIVIAIAITIVSATSGGKSQTPHQQAAAYVTKARRDMQMVQANVQVTEIELGETIKDFSQANLDQVAEAALHAHGTLDNIKTDLAIDGATGSSKLDNAELQLFTASEELRDAMSDLVTYAGNPNAATLAPLNSKFEQGVSDWNSAVRYIWHIANEAGGPPSV
jgi:hypothetical protein